MHAKEFPLAGAGVSIVYELVQLFCVVAAVVVEQ